MVHGYHLILPMYGFWLPNDPRGSWSECVRRWELVRFGTSTQSVERKSFEQLTDDEIRSRDTAKKKLKFPAVCLSGSIGRGFATKIAICNYTVCVPAELDCSTHQGSQLKLPSVTTPSGLVLFYPSTLIWLSLDTPTRLRPSQTCSKERPRAR